MSNSRTHWNKIYSTKKLEEVSWFQEKPETSLEFFKDFNLKKDAAIIDVGGGDSLLVDYLLAEGYTNLTVLDISENALERAKKRLGRKAENVTWVVEDITSFNPEVKFDLWHDRAVLHFLNQQQQINRYVSIINTALKKGGYAVLGTFSEKGPEKCSGLVVQQYSLHEMSELLKENFETLQCENVDHVTPEGSVQNFTFCSFKKRD